MIEKGAMGPRRTGEREEHGMRYRTVTTENGYVAHTERASDCIDIR